MSVSISPGEYVWKSKMTFPDLSTLQTGGAKEASDKTFGSSLAGCVRSQQYAARCGCSDPRVDHWRRCEFGGGYDNRTEIRNGLSPVNTDSKQTDDGL